MGDESTRWTIVVDKQMDIDVRSVLAERGMKKGDLSKFVQEAIKWQLLELSAAKARKGVQHLTDEEVEDLVDQALAEVRRG